MANTLLTPTIIADTARVMLENNSQFANKVYRDDKAFEGKIGTTHTIRLPNRFKSNTGKSLNVDDQNEPSSVVTIDTQQHVDFSFDSDALTLTIEDFAARYLKPAMSQLANDIDSSIAGLYQDLYNSVGTPGTTPGTYAQTIQLIATRAGLLGWPKEGLCLFLEPDAYNTLGNGMTGLGFANQVSQDALMKGIVPRAGGWEIYENQNIKNHRVGSHAGTPLTDGTGATGDVTTETNGWSSGAVTLNKGDVFTIDDVNAVNPQSRQSINTLQQFVVNTAISDTGGAIDVPHNPTIVNSGAYQTVDAVPTNDQTVTVLGTASTSYPQNLAFHRDCFALAMADLVLPQGVDFAAQSSYKGISVRVVRAYDINNDSFPVRIDVLYGVKTIYPELGIRLWG